MCAAALVALAAPVRAGDVAARPSVSPARYDRDILPILSNHCFACHGPDDRARQAGLRLDHRAGATAGGRSGSAAVRPGAAADSPLLHRVTSVEPGERMPPPEIGRALSDEQVALLRRWIDDGAEYEPLWSFVPPARPARPAVRNESWPRNAIDDFILARLESAGMAPSAEADRSTLIRRVSLDLTGLPPTPEEAKAFAADQDPGAYERLVDRLLASPHFGERWARVWLDLARYADTKGYEADRRRTMWPYRDWVIRALNDDMPFDRFTIEQIAGDLLPDPTRDQHLATAFHRNTMTNDEGGTADEEFRAAAVVDRVNTTMQAWMGLTVNCAQCHTHKYDPITQTEYYRLFAFLNNTADSDRMDDAPVLPVPTPGQARQRADLDERINALESDLRESARGTAPDDLEAIARLDDLRTRLDTAQAVRGQVLASIPSVPVMQELPARERRATHVHRRGSFLDPGEAVTPGVPSALHPMPLAANPDRLDLARWLVSPDNPLTARVAMNRLWEQLFGRGLVETSENFGVQGDRPSHPDLLDWLAVEFMEQGWSMKRMCRLIVMSATYRQASRVDEASAAADPLNRLLARGPRFRLEAEMIRDQALAASGLLNRDLYGPPVFPPQPDGVWQMVYSNDRWTTAEGDDRHRRALYTFWRRTSPYPSMLTFDAPSRETCVSRRIRTNTPLQALVLLNDPVYVEVAQALARRIARESWPIPADRAARAVWCCLARPPRPAEIRELTALYRSELEHFRADPEAARLMAGDPLGPLPDDADPADLAAWTVVCNVILNLDEFVTRP
ncbi:MAG: PSD1 and planctomycete cytochrome C domain-containing protein [Planctomycetota bacterium]|jgi:mono/diheme cytochrome c family protein